MRKNINRQSSQFKSSYDEKHQLVACFYLKPIIYIELSKRKIKKGKSHGAVVKPTMLYWSECWSVKNSHPQKLKVT